jgi:hypothetical protein
VAVDKQADVGLLTGGDTVAGQVDQVGAAPRGERAPGRGGEVGVLPPSVGDHVGQVDVQQLGGGRAGLADRGLAGQRWETVQCAADVPADVRRPQPLGYGGGLVLIRPEHQRGGVARGRRPQGVTVASPRWL